MTPFLIALLVLAPEDVPQVDERPAATQPAGKFGQWRVELTLGRQAVLANAVKNSIGGEGAPLVQLGVENNLGDVVPLLRGLAVGGGIGAAPREGRVDLLHTEAWAGVSYQLPHSGLWDLFFPYARVDLLLGWGHVVAAAGDGHFFVPGVGFRLGTRVAMPRMGGRARFYGLLDGGFQYRASVVPRLRRASTLEDPPLQPGTPLGSLDLTGYDLRLGVGLEW